MLVICFMRAIIFVETSHKHTVIIMCLLAVPRYPTALLLCIDSVHTIFILVDLCRSVPFSIQEESDHEQEEGEKEEGVG